MVAKEVWVPEMVQVVDCKVAELVSILYKCVSFELDKSIERLFKADKNKKREGGTKKKCGAYWTSPDVVITKFSKSMLLKDADWVTFKVPPERETVEDAEIVREETS